MSEYLRLAFQFVSVTLTIAHGACMPWCFLIIADRCWKWLALTMVLTVAMSKMEYVCLLLTIMMLVKLSIPSVNHIALPREAPPRICPEGV